MRNFRDNDRSGGGNRGGGGRGGFGGGRGGGFGGDRGRPQMHPATCADCGNRCEVPFRPTGDKPVYCSNCFGGKDDNRSGGGRDRGGFGGGRDRGGFGGGRDRDRPQMHSATCADCGDRCEVPFKPTGAKPVFCSNCFADNQGGGSSSKSNSKSKSSGVSQEQFDKLNKRLDKIMQVLERIAPPKEHVIKKEKAMPEWSEDAEAKPVKEKAAPKANKAKKEAPAKKTVAKKKPAAKKAAAKKKPAAKKKATTKKKATKKK